MCRSAPNVTPNRQCSTREGQELKLQPDAEMDELTGLYEARGLSPQTARQVATELTALDPLAAHAELELRIDPENLTNPWLAAISSAVSFTIGALLPLIAIILPPPQARIPVTVAAVLLALAITGWVAARLGGAKPLRPILRVTVGGALAMAITFAIGHLVGADDRITPIVWQTHIIVASRQIRCGWKPVEAPTARFSDRRCSQRSVNAGRRRCPAPAQVRYLKTWRSAQL